MKTTLIIDGNWLLMSRSFILGKQFLKSNPKDMKEEGTRQLEEFMAQSISVVCNRFRDTINNIIFVSDGGSWRKQLKRPADMVAVKYKGNRGGEDELDWDYIFQALNNLSEHTAELGITSSHHYNVEGDDWAWYWSRRLNSQGINAIIWSSDNDLKQLIQVDNGAFTAWYNDKNGIWLPEVLNDKVDDELDFFLRPPSSNPVLERIKIQSGNVNYLNPDLIVMNKIVCGDSGDNIKSIIRIQKNNRTYGVGDKDWEKTMKSLEISSLTDFFEKSDKVITSLLDLSKFKGYSLNKQNVADVFDYNKKLVWLNEAIIPDSIVEAMNNEEYREFDLNEIRNNYKILCGMRTAETEAIEEIFAGIK